MMIWYSSGSEARHLVRSHLATDLKSQIDQLAAARCCAEDFHWNHDGWECTWPREFSLYESEDGPVVVTLEVDREAVPMFTASLIVRRVAP